MEIENCKNCNKPFEKRRLDRQYCGAKCRKKFFLQKRHEDRQQERASIIANTTRVNPSSARHHIHKLFEDLNLKRPRTDEILERWAAYQEAQAMVKHWKQIEEATKKVLVRMVDADGLGLRRYAKVDFFLLPLPTGLLERNAAYFEARGHRNMGLSCSLGSIAVLALATPNPSAQPENSTDASTQEETEKADIKYHNF